MSSSLKGRRIYFYDKLGSKTVTISEVTYMEIRSIFLILHNAGVLLYGLVKN